MFVGPFFCGWEYRGVHNFDFMNELMCDQHMINRIVRKKSFGHIFVTLKV